MNTKIFSQTMRTSAYQTWFSTESFATTKAFESMVGCVGSIDCGNSVNNPIGHPRPLIRLQ